MTDIIRDILPYIGIPILLLIVWLLSLFHVISIELIKIFVKKYPIRALMLLAFFVIIFYFGIMSLNGRKTEKTDLSCDEIINRLNSMDNELAQKSARCKDPDSILIITKYREDIAPLKIYDCEYMKSQKDEIYHQLNIIKTNLFL